MYRFVSYTGKYMYTGNDGRGTMPYHQPPSGYARIPPRFYQPPPGYASIPPRFDQLPPGYASILPGFDPLSQKPTMSFLFIQLPRVDWYTLGLQLDLGKSELDKIKRENEGDNLLERLSMYKLWLRKQEDASYRQLVAALHLANESAVARKVVAGKYMYTVLHNLRTCTCA